MDKLLFLVHRIPFPPNKGDKVRSFNLLKHLARNNRVLLGAFVDDPEDWQYESTLRKWSEEVRLAGINRPLQKLRSATSLCSGEALSLRYFRDRSLAAWVNQKVRVEGVRRVLVYSSPMAQYVSGIEFENMRRVVDMVDVDSEKWKQYSELHRGPKRWIYAREGARLLEFERRVAAEFDTSVFVTKQEAAVFRGLAPESADRIVHINNGVDVDYFSPDHELANPYSSAAPVFVFTGAMDYWANVDAVVWFAGEIFPKIRLELPQASFYVVGGRPTDNVRRLAKAPGVFVTGAVDDVRPYIAAATAAVAPLRVARGLQNKVLEAMAMGKPVIATTAAMEGIAVDRDFHKLVHDEPAQMSHAAVELVRAGACELGMAGREFVLKNHGWGPNLSRIDALLH